MSNFLKVILTILVFLAISSGVTKIMLMPQDVEFFGNYGFTNSILIAYGVAQLIGGILLIHSKNKIPWSRDRGNHFFNLRSCAHHGRKHSVYDFHLRCHAYVRSDYETEPQ